MTLKFLRNVLVYGQHRAQGSIHEVKDSDATLLIADGAAVRLQGESTPAPETASEPMTAAESATIATKKAGRPKMK